MMANQHTSFMVGNVRVFFPFEPYETQREYVESVVKALINKHHAILESPTGTGKTLSLLCSSLAWLQSQHGTKSLIYYTSRTHIQLAQAAKEMKRTAYAKIPSVVIGSRAQMCLNDEVRQQAGDHLINRACRNAIAKNACSFHSNYEQKLEVMDLNGVHDIEDLCHFGRTHQCCPYYASKKIAETKASLVFMPYNYLLDTSLKKSTQLKLENSVIIFDEAHNIEGVLKDSVSGSFTDGCLDIIRDSCSRLPSKIHDALNKEKHGLSRTGYDPKDKRNAIVDEFSAKQNGKQDKEVKVNPIEELAEKLTNERLKQVSRCVELLKRETKDHLEVDKACTIDKVFHTMKQANIQYSTSDLIVTTLDSMASFWSIAGVMSPVTVARDVSAITNLSHVISLLFPGECLSLTRQATHEKKLAEFYTAYVKGTYETSVVLRKGDLKDWELNVWCLHPAIGLQKIIDSNCIGGPRSLIVTSGTLAPMRSIERDLETKFKTIREFKHVIGDEQLKIMIIGEAPNSYSLVSHFEATRKDEYPIALGKTLLPLFQVLPYGTLVFFQSYSLMNRVVKYWKERSSIWKDMTSASTIYIESKTQNSFLSDMTSFKKKIDSGTDNTRAVFLGICRGKLSEGVNLEGNHCRSVILTGLPFPSLNDPKVVATRKFHEKRGDRGGNLWYSQQMLRALNQTIGRVIRSKSDFGMLFLCDPRFKTYRYSLSEWAKKFFPADATRINVAETEVKQFFHQHGIKITESASESAGCFTIGLSNKSASLASFFNLSPFSEESNKGSQGSKTSGRSNGSVRAIDSASPPSAQERQAAMVAAYRVDRETYNRVKNSRLQAVNEDEASSAKRPKTTSDVFNTICSQPQSQPESLPQVSNPSTPTRIPVPNGTSQVNVPPRQASQSSAPTNGSANRGFSENLVQNPSQPGGQNMSQTPKPPPKSLNIFKKRAKTVPKPKQTQSTDVLTLRLVDELLD